MLKWHGLWELEVPEAPQRARGEGRLAVVRLREKAEGDLADLVRELQERPRVRVAAVRLDGLEELQVLVQELHRVVLRRGALVEELLGLLPRAPVFAVF